jgi:hypothetical protein
MRDVDSDYRGAYLDEHEMCVRAGRTEDADEIAAILRDHYGVDVTPAAEPAPERVTAEPAPENTAAPKPAARKPRAAKPKTE